MPVEKNFYTPAPVGLEFTIKHIYTLENEKNNVPMTSKFFSTGILELPLT